MIANTNSGIKIGIFFGTSAMLAIVKQTINNVTACKPNIGMSEIEAVTRASGAQITLAKLVLVGAANLVCITILLCMEVYLQNSYKEIGQMVLYCLVPYLVCMVALLRLIRLQKKQSLQICAIVMLGSCICWGMSARILPWLYETSAVGVWIVTFLIFAMFFINEIHYIAEMRKEGKMFGIVA